MLLINLLGLKNIFNKKYENVRGKKWEFLGNLCTFVSVNGGKYTEQLINNRKKRTMLLLGEYDVSIDDKGRFRLPSDLLGQLGKTEKGQSLNLVLHCGMEDCIWMWHEDVFKHLLMQLSKLNFFNSRQRQFQRFFQRGMTKLTTDKADRVLLRERLLEFSGIEKNGAAVLTCQQQRIEIWSPEIYRALFSKDDAEDFSDLSDMVMGGGGETGAESDSVDIGDFFSGLLGNDKTMKE